jgi:hypothetical protein
LRIHFCKRQEKQRSKRDVERIEAEIERLETKISRELVLEKWMLSILLGGVIALILKAFFLHNQ